MLLKRIKKAECHAVIMGKHNIRLLPSDIESAVALDYILSYFSPFGPQEVARLTVNNFKAAVAPELGLKPR